MKPHNDHPWYSYFAHPFMGCIMLWACLLLLSTLLPHCNRKVNGYSQDSPALTNVRGNSSDKVVLTFSPRKQMTNTRVNLLTKTCSTIFCKSIRIYKTI